MVHSCPTKLVTRLMATKNQTIEKDGIQATKLCTHKDNVNQINEMHLDQLPGQVRTFSASDSDSSQILDKQVPVDNKINLKVGAQVTTMRGSYLQELLFSGLSKTVTSLHRNMCNKLTSIPNS